MYLTKTLGYLKVGSLSHRLGTDLASHVGQEKGKVDIYPRFDICPFEMQDYDSPHSDSNSTAAFLTSSQFTHQDQGAVPFRPKSKVWSSGFQALWESIQNSLRAGYLTGQLTCLSLSPQCIAGHSSVGMGSHMNPGP